MNKINHTELVTVVQKIRDMTIKDDSGSDSIARGLVVIIAVMVDW